MQEAYAQALWQTASRGMEPKKAVRALKDRLAAEGRERLLPQIGRAYLRIAEREMRRTRTTLSIAHGKDEARAKKAARELSGTEGLPKDLDVAIDESLIGGWRLEGNGQLIDASFKKDLLEIYHRTTGTV